MKLSRKAQRLILAFEIAARKEENKRMAHPEDWESIERTFRQSKSHLKGYIAELEKQNITRATDLP